MMPRWFALQKAFGGRVHPVVFADDRPSKSLMHTHFDRLVEGSIIEIPAETEGMPFKALCDFMMRGGKRIEPMKIEGTIGFLPMREASCQQGMPCRDTDNCPDPVGCGMVVSP